MPETFPFDPPPPPRFDSRWSTWVLILAVLLVIAVLSFFLFTS